MKNIFDHEKFKEILITQYEKDFRVRKRLRKF